MPTVNLYNIVTNDKYELPYLCDIKGRQAAADFLGISLTHFCRLLKTDKWKGEYKAVCVGICPVGEDFYPNENILPLTEEERNERANTKREKRIRIARHKRMVEHREYYRTHRNEVLERAKVRYRQRKAAQNG